MPLHHDTQAPLIADAVRTLLKICDRFMEHIIKQRESLEEDLAEHLPTVTSEDLRSTAEAREPEDA